MNDHPVITRFAPSPTGRLHLGHIYAARFARDFADKHGGEMHLRIEDIDHTRCRDIYYDGIYEDLDFMGLGFDGPVMIQSQRMAVYQAHLDRLKARGLIYPCHLTRRELDDLLSAPHGPSSGRLVSNTDQLISADGTAERAARSAPAWRLRMEAIRPLIQGLTYQEHGQPPQVVDAAALGDAIIARKDIATSYHLSVVIDDAETGVTHVTRGSDLQDQTPLHRLLQSLFDLPETIWHHHPLIADKYGKRLAKRDEALSIEALRNSGRSATDINNLLNRTPLV